ncbi:3-phosphoshikimate 1-carboxyvinyltransferase [Microbacterium sp. APC 3898]|uniref:3-phosphoshikimate 1-carboxyvinyltransferase n=1 Tax=Planococcus notacanthi TaxID=3035188 RepID=A0ABT7ZGK9_9BACL|nr:MULTISPECIES: 3-phosphoshikimate 1-carboxyvinyltransferase [Terrabacteria group]MBF6632499.1 3-phosphoshikimate 1-carboxyvinyltransferase [Planococcus sp. (in: firmicutes)]MDN3426286.1 3-phosphoshikimate 1-carboxyvinyltransferase [Planococcus sp. APC 4016]MDN3497982.1 3-phosphoshikimate 1-carboxyvinyltransferase [Microbacterium sp. APC 3898]
MALSLAYKKPSLTGSIQVPGDKSISHRAIMFGSMASGTTTVKGFLMGDDCLSTISCFQKLGVKIDISDEVVTIQSEGEDSWKEPSEVLDTGNSGTTTRLMLGLLAGTSFHSVLAGDESIAKRPMKRIINPLREMGADIRGRMDGQYTPLAVQGTALKAIDYTLPVASAQVKSAILLAALKAEGKTVIHEPIASRDHTEIMLEHFGATITRENQLIKLEGGQKLTAAHVQVPGDISSAAFMIGAALVTENSKVTLKNVGINPTRTGILDVIEKMGASFELVENDTEGERSADVTVYSSKLKGTEIGGELIPRLIDEIPLIALIATQAEGTTVIKDAEELRVKETDRIAAVVKELSKMGANIEATEDGMIIQGPTALTGAEMTSYGDHRLGMMAAIGALAASGEVVIDDPECISISYPNFFEHLNLLTK